MLTSGIFLQDYEITSDLPVSNPKIFSKIFPDSIELAGTKPSTFKLLIIVIIKPPEKGLTPQSVKNKLLMMTAVCKKNLQILRLIQEITEHPFLIN